MKIGLQNFQGIGAYTEIPIAPITLFYGPNSAGKSTVADAIEFISKTLRDKNTDWQEQLERHARRNRTTRPLEKGYKGEPEDVVITVDGTFSKWALGQIESDLSNEIESGFNFAERHGELIEALYPNDDADDGSKFEYQLFFSSAPLPARDDTFSFRMNSGYLRKSYLFLDGIPFFRYSLPSLGDQRFAFNTQHPFWNMLDNGFETGFMSAFEDTLVDIGIEDGGVDEIYSASWQYVEFNGGDIDPFDKKVPIQKNVMRHEATLEATSEMRAARDLINLFIKLPQHSMLGVLNVPPLRPIPQNDAIFTINKYHSSMACWESLAGDVRENKLGKKLKETEHALPFVNSILTSRDFLETGYVVDGDVKFKFSLDTSEFNNLIHLDPPSQQKMLKETPAEVHLYLVYQPEGFPVEIADVGVGISQVVPVLYGCWRAMTERCNVHIQQPELHLHPKLQAQLGDVFIKCISPAKGSGVLLLESHSEHLLLRLLRRIRETNKNDISAERSLKADQVSVVYVNKDECGLTKLTPLRLDEDGDFIDDWPGGFFEESYREKFAGR